VARIEYTFFGYKPENGEGIEAARRAKEFVIQTVTWISSLFQDVGWLLPDA